MSILILVLTLSMSEAEVVEAHCRGSQEVVLEDNTRVDCLYESALAVEYDFAHKWTEAVGQSLHYARVLGGEVRPGIVLILRKKSDKRYVSRVEAVIDYYKLPILLVILKLY